MRENCMLRAMRRGLETEPRFTLDGHEGGNPGHSQGEVYGPPRQSSTLPTSAPRSGQSISVCRHSVSLTLPSRAVILDQYSPPGKTI